MSRTETAAARVMGMRRSPRVLGWAAILIALLAWSGTRATAGDCETTDDCVTTACLVVECLSNTCTYSDGPDGTQCPDLDGNACTGAACRSGNCDQDFSLRPGGFTCPDTDGNACTEAGCNGSGQCDQSRPAPPGTDCPDSGSECLLNKCDGAGRCGTPKPDGTNCTETDGNPCTGAACRFGVCDQDFSLRPNGFPCPDTDDNVCTEAGCNGSGQCDQSRPAPPGTDCPDSGSECLLNKCDGIGRCGTPKPDGTNCTETDGNPCTGAACRFGFCNQRFALHPSGFPCPDTDGDSCTEAGCNGAGECNQRHEELSGVPCEDDDPCTRDDVCQSGICVGGPPVSCDDNDRCTIDRCENGSCVCSVDPHCAPQGCTPGYWKNNADKKRANAWPAGYAPTMRIRDVFVIPACASSSLGSATLVQGLAFKGGVTFSGTFQSLSRAGIAAVLNAASACVQYPQCTNQVVDRVNAALASCDPRVMKPLAAQLDQLNSQSCPLNQQGACTNR